MPKMTAHDYVEAYLQMFENTATTEGWDPDDWARALAPLLTGEAQRAFFSLPTEMAAGYDNVKQEILRAAQCFHDWVYQPRRPARTQAAKLTRLAQHWLMDGAPMAALVTERVVVDRLLRALPRTHRQAVGMRNPTSTLELVEAIELVEAAHRREAGERVPPFSRRVAPEQRAPEGISRPIGRTAAPEPRDKSMPTAPSPPKAHTWSAGCVLHQEPPMGAPTADRSKRCSTQATPSVSSKRGSYPRATRPRPGCQSPACTGTRDRYPLDGWPFQRHQDLGPSKWASSGICQWPCC